MKKYLMMAAAALMVGASFTGCSKETNLYDPAGNAEKFLQDYAAAFYKVFGQPAENQTWGFGATAGARMTRAGEGVGEIIKPDFDNYPGEYNVTPPAITEKEAAWVQDWFSKNPGLTTEGLDIHNFYLQHVSNNGTTKNGYFHTIEGKTEWEAEARTYNGIVMDKLHVGAVTEEGNTVHVLDFNATQGGKWGIVYVKDGSALQFGYHDPYFNNYYWYFKLAKLTVPGECFADGVAREGWYVGLSYYALKVEVADLKYEEIGKDRLDYADDWILKIVPGEGEIIPGEEEKTNPDYRVIAEDLTVSDASDFDFNDVVFDVTYDKEDATKATITLQAAGGTLPLEIRDAAGVAHEVHAVFGEEVKSNGQYPMINTNAGPSKQPVSFGVTINKNADEGDDGIRLYVKKSDDSDWIEMKATRAKAAGKIKVDHTYQWCNERQGIESKYPSFKDYVSNPNVKWY